MRIENQGKCLKMSLGQSLFGFFFVVAQMAILPSGLAIWTYNIGGKACQSLRRVATCKPGKPGLTSFSETLTLFFIQFLLFRKMKVLYRTGKMVSRFTRIRRKNWLATRLSIMRWQILTTCLFTPIFSRFFYSYNCQNVSKTGQNTETNRSNSDVNNPSYFSWSVTNLRDRLPAFSPFLGVGGGGGRITMLSPVPGNYVLTAKLVLANLSAFLFLHLCSVRFVSFTIR